MIARYLTALAAALTTPFLGLPDTVEAQEPGSAVYSLEPIALQSGWNDLPRLTQDGLDGAIVLGWRDNGNAHSYDLFVVLVDTDRSSDEAWQVVGFESEANFADSIRDAPHVGEDMTRSVRFARGVIDGRPATLAMVATRDISDQGIPHPTPALIEVFVLRQNTEGSGLTAYYFERSRAFRTTVAYCHAEMALHQELTLPLRAGYEGGTTSDGC